MDILYQSKQSIDTNNYEHQTSTLTKTFHKLLGVANPYVWSGCGPQTICDHRRVQVSGSMDPDTINANKQVDNQQQELKLQITILDE